MKQIEIVSHCYAEEIPDFAALLTAQLSSLAEFPPERCRVRYTLCQTPTDRETYRVAREFELLYLNERLPVELLWIMQTKRELFRRAIGRNIAAKRTKADILWFADCDYCFGPGCLDALSQMEFTTLVYPREVLIHLDHATGDSEIARIQPGTLCQLDTSRFVTSRPKVAIGGIQIVPGDMARAKGYCDGTKWIQPRRDERPFPDFRDDRAARAIYGASHAIDLPHVYRLRHTRTSYETEAQR